MGILRRGRAVCSAVDGGWSHPPGGVLGDVSVLANVGRSCTRAALCLSQFLMCLMWCNDQKWGDVQLYPLLVVIFLVPAC